MILSVRQKRYLLLTLAIIVLGLLSRKIGSIPLCIGDMLWAMVIYSLVRVATIKKSIKIVVFISLTISFLVEFSQLDQANWINSIRATLPGRLILGRGFLWSDLVAYSTGVVLLVIGENLLKLKRRV